MISVLATADKLLAIYEADDCIYFDRAVALERGVDKYTKHLYGVTEIKIPNSTTRAVTLTFDKIEDFKFDFELKPGIVAFLRRLDQNPLVTWQQLHPTLTEATSELVSYIMNLRAKPNPTILLGLRLAAIGGNKKLFDSLMSVPSYAAFCDNTNLEILGKAALNMIFGKATLTRPVDFSTMPIVDTQRHPSHGLCLWVHQNRIQTAMDI